jgi:hypothetical protein
MEVVFGRSCTAMKEFLRSDLVHEIIATYYRGCELRVRDPGRLYEQAIKAFPKARKDNSDTQLEQTRLSQ